MASKYCLTQTLLKSFIQCTHTSTNGLDDNLMHNSKMAMLSLKPWVESRTGFRGGNAWEEKLHMGHCLCAILARNMIHVYIACVQLKYLAKFLVQLYLHTCANIEFQLSCTVLATYVAILLMYIAVTCI